MKAISIWQPWASAIAIGAKRFETRSWETRYRGPLLIHASKRCVQDEMIQVKCSWTWCGVLRPLGLSMGGMERPEEFLPFGKIIAIANLVDCRAAGELTLQEVGEWRFPAGEENKIFAWNEGILGDFTLGRFAWQLDDVRQLKRPIDFRGAQGLFEVPDELLKGCTEVAMFSGVCGTPLTD